jgi:predicted GIY-YIG superfamily endonuclease
MRTETLTIGDQTFIRLAERPHVTRGGFPTLLVEWGSHCEVCGAAYTSVSKPGAKPSRRCEDHRRRTKPAKTEPAWLAAAAAATTELSACTRNDPRAKHKVYVALLSDDTLGRHGVYVGLTGKTPEERFAQHKAGIKAGKKFVFRYGVQLLPHLYEHLNPMTLYEARAMEARLKAALEQVVPWTEGGH